MRVLHVTPYFAPAYGYGGPPRSVLALCQALQRAGTEVEVVTTTANGGDDLAAAQDVEFEGVRVTYLERILPRRYYRAAGARQMLRDKASAANLFHIHGCWNFLGWDSAAVARRYQRPYVSTPRGMLSPWSMSHGHTALKRLSYAVFERPAQRHAYIQHATSAQERDELLQLGFGRPVRVIPNGVDIPGAPPVVEVEAFRRRLGIHPGQRVVLTLGRLHPKKGLELLGEAMSLVTHDVPDCTLLVVGSGEAEYEQSLRRSLHARLQRRVIFAGELQGTDRDLAYAAANVFALVSAAENFGMVVAEAMAAPLPVVVSRVLPWPDLETWGAGRLVDRTPQSVAAGIRQYIASDAEAREAGLRGQAIVRRQFGWDAVAAEMIRVYDDTLMQTRG